MNPISFNLFNRNVSIQKFPGPYEVLNKELENKPEYICLQEILSISRIVKPFFLRTNDIYGCGRILFVCSDRLEGETQGQQKKKDDIRAHREEE